MSWKTKKSQQMQVVLRNRDKRRFCNIWYMRSNLQLFLLTESVDTERDLGSVQEV